MWSVAPVDAKTLRPLCVKLYHQNGEPATLEMNSVYLVDSGAQYSDGTTDITRTVAIGDPGDDVRSMYTRVLKGHIALDVARFPKGTTGNQLDALARQFLWSDGYDYDHGTGHGVGQAKMTNARMGDTLYGVG